MNSTQKVNDKCLCGSGKKYKKCCINKSQSNIIPSCITNIEKQEVPLLIEGTLRHQPNIIHAQTKYGNLFNGKIVSTKYFGDDIDVPTLVCCDDINLVLGKPRYPEKFIDNEYKIKLVDRNNCGLYSIEVLICDNNNITRENIRQKLIKEIEVAIDTKVYKWMETKQTKFNNNEKDKIEQFNMELITFLNSLRDTSKIPTNFTEQIETFYISNKIICIMETINS